MKTQWPIYLWVYDKVSSVVIFKYMLNNWLNRRWEVRQIIYSVL